MPEPEATLIQRAQKGDHDAFAALVDEHQRYVYNLALRVVKDENEALDLTQETFVRELHTVLTNGNGPGPYVLVGASFGGLLISAYTAHHPADVAGLVFIDAVGPASIRRPFAQSLSRGNPERTWTYSAA